jgi:bacterioferritin (cytochrome b1)
MMENLSTTERVTEARAVLANLRAHRFTLNLMRASELRRAWEIAGVVELIEDVELMTAFAEQAADEARHSQMLATHLAEIGGRLERVPHDLDYVGRLRARGVGLHVPALRMAESTLDHRALVPFLVDLIDLKRRNCRWLPIYAAAIDDARTQQLVHEMLAEEEAHLAFYEGTLEHFRSEGLGAEIDAHMRVVGAVTADLHDVDYEPRLREILQAMVAADAAANGDEGRSQGQVAIAT